MWSQLTELSLKKKYVDLGVLSRRSCFRRGGATKEPRGDISRILV